MELEITSKRELILEKGWMNSAGALGLAVPFPYWQNQAPIAYLTPPLTDQPRPPVADRRVIRFPGGFVLRSNAYNLGLRAALKENTERWARSKIPVWVHLFLEDQRTAERMLAQVEACPAVSAVEISLPMEWNSADKLALLKSLQCELPLVLRIGLNEAGEEWVKQLPASTFSALTIGPPLGSLPDSDGSVVSGWMYGPALFPLALQTLLHWKGPALPLILGCGVFRQQDATTALERGAAAVQLDAALWLGGIF